MAIAVLVAVAVLGVAGFVVTRPRDATSSAGSDTTAARSGQPGAAGARGGPSTTGRNVPDEFKEAPGVVASSTGLFATELPVAYLENPAAATPTKVLAKPKETDGAKASPDGRYVAVLANADAVGKGRYDIVATDTGDVVSRAEFDGKGGKRPTWAPDGSALAYQDEKFTTYLHRVGGATAIYPLPSNASGSNLDGPAFSSTDQETEMVWCSYGATVRLTAGKEARDPVFDRGSCEVAQFRSDRFEPVAVYVKDKTIYRAVPGQDPRRTDASIVPDQAGGLKLQGGQAGATCQGLAVLGYSRKPSPNELGSAFVYSFAQDKIVETRFFNLACPIPSPDGRRFAYAQTNGATFVADVESGESKEVARTGTPISWSADGATLLVEGNGLFRVKADGSGGERVVEQFAQGNTQLSKNCRLGDSGFALLQQGDKVALYEVGANRVTDVPGALDDGCTLTPDRRWALSGSLLVDLAEHRGTVLPPISAKSDNPLTGTSSLRAFRWRGAQQVTVAGNSALYKEGN